MLAKSTGRYGDQVTLTSTIHNYSEPTILTFSYYLQQDDASALGTLLVYLLSIQRAPVQLLFETILSTSSNEWQHHELCIPAGTYYIQFLARLGLPFKSDIGLDDVELTDRRCVAQETASNTGNCVHLNRQVLRCCQTGRAVRRGGGRANPRGSARSSSCMTLSLIMLCIIN